MPGDATLPPKSKPAKDRNAGGMANGNGRISLNRVLNGVTIAALVGLFGLLWNMHGKLAVIEATMVTKPELQRTIREEVPPQWFREDVQEIGDALDEHIRQTADDGHRGR